MRREVVAREISPLLATAGNWVGDGWWIVLNTFGGCDAVSRIALEFVHELKLMPVPERLASVFDTAWLSKGNPALERVGVVIVWEISDSDIKISTIVVLTTFVLRAVNWESDVTSSAEGETEAWGVESLDGDKSVEEEVCSTGSWAVEVFENGLYTVL